MNIQIQDAPKPKRAENEYDKHVEALAEFEDGTKVLTLSFPADEFPAQVKLFREATKHAGYRSRERDRSETDENVTASFAIFKKRDKPDTDDSGADEAVAELETALAE